jgi:hypothetical protein
VEWNRADDVSSGGRFVKFPLTAFFIFVLAWPSLAQDMNEIAVRAKRSHNDCFYNSATAQLQAVPSQRRKSADANLIAEQAFVACTTEEQVLATIISSLMRPNMAQIAMLGNRTGLKRELNDIFQNPGRYAK